MSIDCEHLCSILSVLVRGHDLLQRPSVHNQRDIQSVVSANTPLVRGGYCASQGWILCIHLVCLKQPTLSGVNIPTQTLQLYTPV